MKNHKIPIHITFRQTYMVFSFIALCLACIISLALVLILLKYFYTGPITEFVVIIIGILICVLSIIIGGLILWKSSNWFSKPIIALDQAVGKVAEGDFDVVINLDSPKFSHREIHTELNTLVSHFNIMTKELKSMEYMSRDFMSNVSHEIKTPIATITGITEMLLDDGLESEEHEDYIRMVNESSERISDLCDNMLKLSKLDSQQILDKKDHVRLDEQIRKAAILVMEIHDAERYFFFELDEVYYDCDSDLMMQVWMNLLNNAIKYSPQDSQISVYLNTGQVEDGEKIKIEVHNEGEIITTEKIKRMFDKFYQCEQSHTNQGSGLGLSIVSRIISLHNGNIYCSSEEEKGITMHIEL